MSRADDVICRHVRELHGYVPGEQPRVPGLIKLNTNENPYPPSPQVMNALKDAAENQLRMYPDPVCTGLRGIIADLHGCAPEQVLVGNGSDEVLALCTRAFVENEGVIACFEPTYSLYPVLAAIRPAQVKLIELTSNYEWQIPDQVQASLFYLANPNAPTGMSFPREQIRAFCETFSGVVVIDEAYADFAAEHCMDLALTMPRVLVSRTLSKSYSLAGIRCGYVVGPVELIAAMYKIKDSYNVNALTQRLAAAALKDQAAMRANVARIIQTRDRISSELSSRGYTVYPSAANFLWVRPDGITAAKLFQHLREKNVLTRYFQGKHTGDCLRITIGTDEQMDAFLNALPGKA